MRCCDTIFVDFSVLWLLICLDICVAAADAVDLVTVAPAFDATAVAAATIVSSIAAAAVTHFAFVTAAFSLFH